jgi:uncharacterized protein YqhQ
MFAKRSKGGSMRVLSGFIHNLTDKNEEREAETEMQRRLAIVIVMSLLFSVFVVFVADAIAGRNTSLMFAKNDLLITPLFAVFLLAPQVMRLSMGKLVLQTMVLSAIMEVIFVLRQIL